MAVIRMKKADLAKVSAYENLTDALVKHDGGDFWIVDTRNYGGRHGKNDL